MILTTAIREIIRGVEQPYQGHHLTTVGFVLESGVWVRRTHFEPKVFDLVYEVEGREKVVGSGNGLR